MASVYVRPLSARPPMGAHFEELVRAALVGHAVCFADRGAHPPDDDVQALITPLSLSVTDAQLARYPKLRCVGNIAVGLDNIDLDACRARGVAVVHTPGVLTRATAELTLALLLACARRLGEGERLVRAGCWEGFRLDLLLGRELHGMSACIVGAGRIGRAVAGLFGALGMDVSLVTRAHADADIERILGQSDVVSLHLPLTDATLGWLSSRRIALLRPGCIVLNTARGAVVDEEALIGALSRGDISAGLDVYGDEPDVDPRLRALDNVVLSPHLGSATTQTRARMVKLCAEGVAAVLAGKTPDNLYASSEGREAAGATGSER